MKKITKYVAEDGVEFLNEEECITHENNVQHIFEEIDGFQNNPSEALIVFMAEVQNRLGIELVSYEGYVNLFKDHKPCAHHCSLWRTLADYSNDYPTIFKAYGELIDAYIALYGEK